MLQKVKDNFQYIVLGFLVLVFFRQCGVNNEISRIKKESRVYNQEITAKLDETRDGTGHVPIPYL